MQALHRGRGRNVNVRQQQAHNSHRTQCQIKRTALFMCQRRLRMRNKRTDTCHIYRQIPQKQQIFGYAFNTLSRKPYHNAGAEFIPQFFYHQQTFIPLLPAHLGIKPVVQFLVCGFYTHQIAVGAGFAKSFVFRIRPLADT